MGRCCAAALTTLRIIKPRRIRTDLILLDATWPRMNGFAVCRTLRRESAVPIILLTAPGKTQDRVRGLDAGADKCLVKPCECSELVAQVRALFRRRALNRRQFLSAHDRIVMGDIVLDRAARQAWQDNQPIDLHRKEFDLLRVLMERAGRSLSRHDLLDQVWGEEWAGDPRTLDVHICWLREKLECSSRTERYIETIRGYGYRLADPAVPAVGVA